MRVEALRVDGELELGADAVGRGDQQRVLETRRLQIEQAAEAAEIGVRARTRRRFRGGRDAIDQRVAGVDVDAGVLVGDTVLPCSYAVLMRHALSSTQVTQEHQRVCYR